MSPNYITTDRRNIEVSVLIFGIDPGITGAVAVIHNHKIMLFDTPVAVMKKSNGKNKTDFIAASMADLFQNYNPYALTCHAFLEQVGSMPGQGVSSTFGFGKGYGMWIGILAALNIPYTLVTPQAWKKQFMLGKCDKDDSRIRAIELFPSCAKELSRKKDIGRADALLIAEYGRRSLR